MILKTELANNLPAIRGDAVQLQQVLMNLVLNALDSMADGPADRRTLTVRTAENPEGWIEVSVEDAGRGISPENIPKLFDPFFTTKREGMGLGLSISRSIVQSHGGRIWAETRADGATFRFVIPVSLAGPA
jgi:signal transduction histidine kinase